MALQSFINYLWIKRKTQEIRWYASHNAMFSVLHYNSFYLITKYAVFAVWVNTWGYSPTYLKKKRNKISRSISCKNLMQSNVGFQKQGNAMTAMWLLQ